MATRVVTVNDVLDGHVGLDLECFDRIYLNGWVPTLQVPGQVVGFLTRHLGFPIPSPAVLERIGLGFRKAVTEFAAEGGIPVVRFAKGQRKLEVMRPHLDRLARAGKTGVAAIGIAQEFQRVFTESETFWGRQAASVVDLCGSVPAGEGSGDDSDPHWTVHPLVHRVIDKPGRVASPGMLRSPRLAAPRAAGRGRTRGLVRAAGEPVKSSQRSGATSSHGSDPHEALVRRHGRSPPRRCGRHHAQGRAPNPTGEATSATLPTCGHAREVVGNPSSRS